MKVKRMIKSDVDTFKVGDIIKVKLTDGVKVQAMAITVYLYFIHGITSYLCILLLYAVLSVVQV